VRQELIQLRLGQIAEKIVLLQQVAFFGEGRRGRQASLRGGK
jgi:hypothetical protein